MIYFVRVNGDTAYNDSNHPKCYVSDEPPIFPQTFFNYYNLCLDQSFVRIGWPDTGDLTQPSKAGALAQCYDLMSVPTYIREYLLEFKNITVCSIILMPDKAVPGDLFIGEVQGPYHYFHNVPVAPYECAHRVSVSWDRNSQGMPIRYKANSFGINIHGGFWRYAFARLDQHHSASAILNRR